MKILVVSNLYPPDVLGGYELGCRQAADGLRDAGHDVLVLTAPPRNGPTPPVPGVSRRLKLVDFYDPYSAIKADAGVRRARAIETFGLSSFNVHALIETVAEFQPDVAYLWNLVGLGGLGLMAGLQQLGVPWVMHLMDRVPRELCRAVWPDGGADPGLSRAFRRACRGRFLCCSQTTLDEIAADGPSLDGLARVVPNWVTTAGTPGRTEYMSGGRLRVVTAGTLSTDKGIDILVRAAGLLRDRGVTNVDVDVYGFGSDAPFRTLAKALGVDDRVRFLGSRTQAELYALYPEYDVFAFPTREREPFGFAPLEAAAHGCAAVVSRRCGFSEWFVDGLDCLKADRTPEAFADALQKLAGGEMSVADLGRRGCRTALRDFRLSAVLPAIEGELREAVLVGGGPARPAGEAYRLAVLAEKTFHSLAFDAAARPTVLPPATHEDRPMTPDFYNEYPGKWWKPAGAARRILRRIQRPFFYRLRDLLAQEQARSAALEKRLATAEAAAWARAVDAAAVTRRLARMEDLLVDRAPHMPNPVRAYDPARSEAA